MLSGWKTYIAAILIGVVGAAAALGWITEETRNTLLVFLSAFVAGALRSGVKSAEAKAKEAAINSNIAANASTEAAASAQKAAKAVK